MRINEFPNYPTWEKVFQVHLIWYSSSTLKWYPVGHLHKGGVWLSHKGGHSVIPSSGSSTFHDVILTSIMTLAEKQQTPSCPFKWKRLVEKWALLPLTFLLKIYHFIVYFLTIASYIMIISQVIKNLRKRKKRLKH